MKDNKFLENTETFLHALRLSPPPPESFDTIHNLMGTIKEYREYIKPNPASWNKYILEVFQILGFNTKNELKRLLSLSEMGGVRSKRAVVVLLRLDEEFKEIAPDLEWSTFLFFAMHFFQVEWGMLTDGQKIKIFNRNHNMKELYLDVDLETILIDGNFDDFYALYNVVSLIRGGPAKSIGKTSQQSKKQSKRYDLNYHLANKSNTVITLFDVLRAKIKSLSNQIDERFNKFYIGYYTYNSFCQIRPQKDQLKIWVNLDIHQVSDPLGLCRDVRNVGHYGTGKTEIILRSFNDLDAVFDLIQQAYNKSDDRTQSRHEISGRQNRHVLRKTFWTELLEKANQKTSLHANISPGQENWISTGAGKSGLSYNYVIRMNDAQIELYIDNGDQTWNKNTFRYFLQQKDEIERTFGAALDWQLLDDKRASRIRSVILDAGLKDQYYWSRLQDLMIDSMIRFHSAFHPVIAQIDEVNTLKTESVTLPPAHIPQQAQESSKAKPESNESIPQKLLNVLSMYEEMVNHNKSYTEAYKELTRRRGLKSEHTIPDSCTRGLGLNTSEFKALIMAPDQFAAFLIERFPDYKENISKITS